MILVYGGMSISTEPFDGSLERCAAKAEQRLGEKLPISPWDDMGRHVEAPTVVVAFCALGKAIDQ